MATYEFRPPDGWAASLAGLTGGAVTQQILTDIYNAIYNQSATGGRQTLNAAVMPITTGATDSIDFSDYAGKIPIAVVGKKASDSTFEVVNNGAGFQINAANNIDEIMLQGAGSGIAIGQVASNFPFSFSFTGVGPP